MAKVKTVLSWKALLGGLTLAMVVAAGLMFLPANNAAAGGSDCEGDVKVEGGPAFITAPDGQTIQRVCIKAGTQVFTFECGETGDGCYHLNWIYAPDCFYAIAVEVTGGGTSRHCKSISHVAATFIECGHDPA